jgi:drug/metabolite transporter (DMT)-like permease
MSTLTADSIIDHAYRRGALMVIACGFLWSLAGIGVRLTEEATGWHIVFYRSIGLSITLLAYMMWRNKGHVIGSVRGIGLMGFIAGCLTGASFFGNIFALLYTSVANVTFILSTAPFIAALLGRIFLGERVKKRTWLAIACTTSGVLLMVNGGLSSDGLIGMGFAFFMALCYACFTVIMRHCKNIDMVPAALVAGLTSMAFAALFIDNYILPMTDILIALGLGVVQMGIALILFIKGSRHVPAAELTLLTMLEVILSPLWVWMLLNEHPGYWTLIGGTVIILGVVIQASGTRRKRRHPAVY